MGVWTPEVTVECDKCQRVDSYELLRCAGRDNWSTRNIQSRAEYDGWVFRDGKTYCIDCAEEMNHE